MQHSCSQSSLHFANVDCLSQLEIASCHYASTLTSTQFPNVYISLSVIVTMKTPALYCQFLGYPTGCNSIINNAHGQSHPSILSVGFRSTCFHYLKFMSTSVKLKLMKSSSSSQLPSSCIFPGFFLERGPT